jgi:hypothetical protein
MGIKRKKNPRTSSQLEGEGRERGVKILKIN